MLKPLADRVVLKMTKAEETTKSGIILSEGSKRKTTNCGSNCSRTWWKCRRKRNKNVCKNRR